MSKCERKLHVEPMPDESLFQVKVAFSTLDRQHVDQHFGTGKCVLIYGVGKESWSLIEAIEYPDVNENNHNKLPARVEDLNGCSAIYCNACGASAISKLLEKNINPIKVSAGANIHQLLLDLQQELNGVPQGWLARALQALSQERSSGGDTQARLSQLMDEEW